MQHLIDSLYAYNDWANQRVLKMCHDLSASQLDQPRPMGFGTLRATLFHILAADSICLERWQAMAWRPFPTDPQGMSVEDMAVALQQCSLQRAALINAERDSNWCRMVDYRDSKQTPYHHRLRDLLLHVFNHGVHHRAQALNYLKHFERSAGVGIDYIFYRLAEGNLQQTTETQAALRPIGLAVNDQLGPQVSWNGPIIARQFEYGDWAISKLLDIAVTLDDATLDRSFDIGQGSIRKILLHVFDVERWWNSNWTQGPSPFPHSHSALPMRDLRAQWSEVATLRNQYLAGLNDSSAAAVVEISFAAGPPLRFAIADTACQICVHGTHHRAQVINLLRQVDAPSGNMDLIYALAELSSTI
jgi:uncharacterized damage-inducible protein DinB